MVKVFKFAYVMIIFLSLFLAAMTVDGNLILSFLNFLSYFLYNIIFYKC